MPIKNISKNSILAAQFRIKFKDIFNLKQLYIAMHEWMLENDWTSVGFDSKGNIELENKDHFETLYLERIEPNGAKEMYWFWRLQKLPVHNSYYKYHLDVDYHPLYIFPTEVVREGKKLKAHKGEVEVKIWAYIEFDYKGEWSRHPILRFFNRMFPERIFRRDLYSKHKKELYREAYILQAFMKKWFKLKSFLPSEEITPFFPSKAYPAWRKE